LRQIRESTRAVYAALVCGAQKLKTKSMQVCLVEPEELKRLINIGDPKPQGVSIKCIPGKSLRVSSTRAPEFVVPRNRLDEWLVPGS